MLRLIEIPDTVLIILTGFLLVICSPSNGECYRNIHLVFNLFTATHEISCWSLGYGFSWNYRLVERNIYNSLVTEDATWATVEVSDKRNFLCSFSDYLSRCVCKIANSDYWFRHFRPSSRLYACNNSAHIGRVVVKFDIWVFSKIYLENSILFTSDKNNAYFTQVPIYIVVHTSLTSSWNEKCSTQSCREN
jgi:hypothetical protein